MLGIGDPARSNAVENTLGRHLHDVACEIDGEAGPRHLATCVADDRSVDRQNRKKLLQITGPGPRRFSTRH